MAGETLEIFAPLAHRLGLWSFKTELADLSFKYLFPNEYESLDRLVSRRFQSCEALLESVVSFIREHVWSPALLIYRELVHRQYLKVSDPKQVEDADQLLRTLLHEFHETWGAQLDAVTGAEVGTPHPDETLTEAASRAATGAAA